MDPQTQLPQQPVSQPADYQSQTPTVPQPPQAAQQYQAVAPQPPATDTSIQPLTPAPQYDNPNGLQAESPPTPAVDSAAIVQQIASAINGGKNVLVTVSVDPSVDELASALGMTFLLGKLGKHVTAVFSGKIPPAMEFLEPETVFEDTVDSLRDFIIALDKEKADKLRYKVEEDVVKIFITPYKTVLSEKDLEYSQGDFNVDVVLALGVTKREELDKAITAHGRILHDATVVTVNADGFASGLGAIDWRDPEASSVAEMLVTLSEQLGGDQFDSQISTAFLTGLVAQTNRFSNEKTSPKVMTTAAQLMASGANQQLIATNLRHEGMISEPVRAKEDNQPHNDDGEMILDHKDTKRSKKDKSSQSDTTKDVSNVTSKDQPSTIQSKKDNVASPTIPDEKVSQTTEKIKSPVNSVELPPASAATVKPQESPAESLRSTLVKSPQVANNPPIGNVAPVAPVAPVTINELPQPPQVTNDPTINSPAPASINDLPQPSVDSQSSTNDDSLTLPPPIPQKIDASRPHKVIEPLNETERAQDAESPTIGDLKQPLVMPDPPKVEAQKPTFGGTLNATTAEAEASNASLKQPQQDSDLTTLSHDNGPVELEGQAAIDAARSAVEDAAGSTAFDPANNPVQSINAQPMTEASSPTLESDSDNIAMVSPVAQSPQEELSPVEDFMQPHVDQAPIQVPPSVGAEPQMANISSVASPSGAVQPMMPPAMPPTLDGGNLPPLPPMPGATGAGMMPPMPPMPGQTQGSITANTQPQVTPGFMENVSQSQNSWTKSGEEMTQKYAARDAERKARKDEATQKYNNAVEQNNKLQEQEALKSLKEQALINGQD